MQELKGHRVVLHPPDYEGDIKVEATCDCYGNCLNSYLTLQELKDWIEQMEEIKE